MKIGIRLLLLGASFGFLLLALASCNRDQQNSLSYSGSSTIGETVIPPTFEAFSKKTGVKIGSITSDGSGKGIEAVISGQAKLGG